MRKLIAVLAVWPALAVADVDLAMVAAIDSCLQGLQSQTKTHDCIGVLTQQCVAQPDGDTTLGMMLCADAEADAWDVLLNREYQAARDVARKMDAEDQEHLPDYAIRAETLLAAQRAWITYRDANCYAEYALWGAGSMRQIMGADCTLQMTAERTIALHNYADGMP